MMKLTPEEAHALEDPIVRKLISDVREDEAGKANSLVEALQKELGDEKAAHTEALKANSDLSKALADLTAKKAEIAPAPAPEPQNVS